jgi:hypothetical protein
MHKLKILLKVYPKHPKEYGILLEENWERLAWEKMTEQIRPSLRYLKHFIESKWIDTSDKDGVYVCTSGDPDFKTYVDKLKIPLGTLSYYAIVYVEDMGLGTP